jgi:RNA polymerase sigma factor (sigma-70 family)
LSETAFLTQLNEHQGIIYKLVGLYAKDREEKRDLYQEIVLQAWKGWPTFRAESSFSTWLYRVCLNTIFTQQRKRQVVEYRESLDDVAPFVQHSSLEKERAVQLHTAIRSLPETDRAIISLHLDGYENGETANILGITSNNVAVKLHRIKQYLGTLLTPAS